MNYIRVFDSIARRGKIINPFSGKFFRADSRGAAVMLRWHAEGQMAGCAAHKARRTPRRSVSERLRNAEEACAV